MDSMVRRAAYIRAPFGSAVGAARSCNVTAFTAASTGALDSGVSADGVEAHFITFMATQDAHIAFGATTAMTAANTSDWLLIANVPQTFAIVGGEDPYFKVIRDSASGNIYWYRSSE